MRYRRLIDTREQDLSARMDHAMKSKVTSPYAILLLLVAAAATPAGDPSWVRKSSVTGDLPIPNNGDQQTCCVAVDLDKDGREDFVVGERTRTPSVVWYKYLGATWDKRVIDDSRLRLEAGGICFDVDGDDDQDILMKPYNHKAPRIDVLLNPRQLR